MLKKIMLFLFLLGPFKASEPECSRFHYEEKTLEIMIKLELFVQKIKEEMDGTQERLLNSMHDLDNTIKQLRLDWETEKKKIEVALEELTKARTMGQEADSVVGFVAKDVANTSPIASVRFIFKTSLMNEGNGYDNTTGIFTAPVAGTYMFTVQFCVQKVNALYYKIVADDNSIKRGFFFDRHSNSCYTANALTVLRKDGRVWVMCPAGHATLSQNERVWNSFSGVLLHN